MVVVDERLSKGIVRAETRELTDALKEHAGKVLQTFHDSVHPHFQKRSRLTTSEMLSLAKDLHDKAKAAFSPLWCDLEVQAPTRGRPNTGYYEMLHYWVHPKPVEGTSSQLMMIAMFSAWGSRKQISMRANDTLTSFYEHAAQRLLQRCGSREAALRVIGQRLVDTIIIPTLALDNAPATLIGTEFFIPLLDGLLIGRFASRSREKAAGDYRVIKRDGWSSKSITLLASAEFVVKTYIGPAEMTDRQEWIAYEINSWLAAHRNEAAIIRRYITNRFGSLWDAGHMSRKDFESLKEDFWRLHARVIAQARSGGR